MQYLKCFLPDNGCAVIIDYEDFLELPDYVKKRVEPLAISFERDPDKFHNVKGMIYGDGEIVDDKPFLTFLAGNFLNI